MAARSTSCVLLLLLLAAAAAAPTAQKDDTPVPEIFNEVRRDAGTPAAASSPLLKFPPFFNPYMNPYAFIPPGKFMGPMTPTDLLLSRFVKDTSTAPDDAPVPPAAPASPADPVSMAAHFKAKKDEFLTKLFTKITATEPPPADVARRQVVSPPLMPFMDPTYFISKKYEFLSKLLTNINSSSDTNDTSDEVTPTTKPTIVPPEFWMAGFPFIKLPKPTKAPKPPKPPKTKKILKDALDTMILQSFLADMGVDVSNMTMARRGVAPPPVASKKLKTKKVKTTAEPEVTEYHIPDKVDPDFYQAKASDYLDKIFKALNKTTAEDVKTPGFIEPKATVIPLNFWTQPSQTEYTSKLDAFLDLLSKSVAASESKSGPSRKKRSAFLDELLHRVPPSTTPTPDTETATELKKRGMMFKPFGMGLWSPSYLYAARMAAYMDAMNSMGAAEDDSTGFAMKRSVTPSPLNQDLTPVDAAINLIVDDLTELKDEIVGAFSEGIKTQNYATAKPTAAGKAFKKPVWGPKPPTTADPVAPIQKRVDILNDIFDKLVLLEKTLMGEANNATTPVGIQRATAPGTAASKATVVPPSFWAPNSAAPVSPEYYVSKTQEFLQKLYDSKSSTDDE